MNTCSALSKIQNISVELWHPYRANIGNVEQEDPFRYYSIHHGFKLKELKCIDLHKYYPNLNFVKKYFLVFLLGTYLPNLLIQAILAVHFSQKKKDSIFYTRDYFVLIPLLLIKPFLRRKIYLEAHSVPNKSLQIFCRLLFKYLDGVIVVTQQLKNEFVEKYGINSEKILVLPDAVDINRFFPQYKKGYYRDKVGLPQKKFVIGYIGRFHTLGKEKGVSTLIKSLNEVIHLEPGFNPLLICVGGPLDYTEKYFELMNELDLHSKFVKFYDRVDHSEVPFWLHACDVLTIPFPYTKHMAYYASPMKLFEYMAAGKPIIASDLPSIREILTDNKNSILVKPSDPIGIAKAIIKVSRDDSFAKELASQAFADVKKYTWTSRAESIIAFVA